MHSLNLKFPRIILASASPRRQELLQQIGLTFETIPSCIDEHVPPGLSLSEQATFLASAKAHSIAVSQSAGLIIGADTMVALDETVLGKPVNATQASAMLRFLSGKCHDVITGVALVDAATEAEMAWATVTRVQFRDLPASEIDAYIRDQRPFDKAGAYGIQERAGAFVKWIQGCYYNVVGLPLADLVEALYALGEGE